MMTEITAETNKVRSGVREKLINSLWVRKKKFPIFSAAVVIVSMLICSVLPSAQAGCRKQEPRTCEAICVPSAPSSGGGGVEDNSTISVLSESKRWKCELRIIVIMPQNTSIEASLPRVQPALLKAEEYIRSQQIIPPSIAIRWVFYDDECDQARATVSVMDGTGRDCGHVILGPTCDLALAPVARIGRFIYKDGIPVITGAGYTFDFVQRKTRCEDEFYLLIRTGWVSFKRIAFFMIDLLKHFKWNRVVYFYERHGYYNVAGPQTGHLVLSTMAEFFRRQNITYLPFSTDSARTNYTESLKEKVGLSHSIVIMCASPTTIREIMLAAAELNMVDSGEYVFFNIDIFSSMAATKKPPWYMRNDTEERNMRAKNAYTALLQVVARQPEDEEYRRFSDEVKLLTKSKFNYTYPDDEPVSTFVTAFYDAVLLYAYALNDSISKLGEYQALKQPINGTHLAHLMWGKSFKGITGNVTIDSNGDRISDYSLLDLNPNTGMFEIVANYFHDGGLQFVEGKEIHWSGGRTKAPPDRPTCGFDGSLCPDKSLPGYAILSLILGVCVICMGIASFVGYRHYKLEAEINSMTWKVHANDVLFCNSSRGHRGSLHMMAKRGSQTTIYSDDLNSLPGDRQIYIQFGIYKGCKVAIKKINVTNLSLNRTMMLELKRMKDIQHDHLVKFFGASIETDPEPFILTEYCPKGSLQDILENETIKLDWMFKISLMHDIVKGMTFLHSTDIHSHGALKSSNCVVDSRFVLKITDFGLHQLRNPTEEQDQESYAYWKKLLWTAPELLRDPQPNPAGSQKGDVYSFGIIVQEIVSRQGPFYMGDDEKSPKEIIKLVRNGPESYNPPFRPKVDETSYEDVNNIMVKCWAEDPDDRPDFNVLKTIIRKINKENESGNILDNLLQRMEQYANNLEALVEERTQDYFEEKRKCEELLYQLLPKSVAAQLIMGKSVIAETYDQVTIYFSDIVGFTSISAQSTPMQVVDLLNDLYTCFDSIVENFDVYKVETIGDAYMVVSGLPVRNGNLHAREISRMALALLAAVYKFTIRHRPNEQLKLRIGLHSGPCVAGVVGLKMPRYCLFGDTVNTASRMESNGEALKIHISQNTKSLLDTVGTFDVTKRGLVPMKGKGEMLTYWLNGEKTEPVQSSFKTNKLSDGATTGNGPLALLNGAPPISILNNNNNSNMYSLNSAQAGGNKKPNNVSYNFLKANNTKNLNAKMMNSKGHLSLGGEETIKSVTQPLLTQIN
ncbi:atrial natriuretic peptide receptor 1 isoform X4 [Toxorhynchites rutilus septentrionalis]|uniref:atrial natriuretic peptide receptor 1 isoform X4 n=1 Tax=Toxorhynchites rutilus septentrionalis TaxID=329112 RepID=UPI002478EE58|nr:atrial natriuretic peptide receptor 1 isoform X4 [Toxorhynchites rutilus septentrionalis]